ncbi:MAG: peptidylprolyl isomerase [Streptococcaceae bacterium]|jgi:peptidyl-prolyl cis-trans isomerase A (cyclophilin A)|nr:peptidylprolyl isomerase [Streptococcaceae bacterium]
MKNKKNIQILVIGFLALVIVGLLGIFISQNESKSDKNTASSSSSSASAKATSVDTKVTDQSALDALTFPQLSTEIADDEAEVEIDTSAGNITIKLFPKQAPLAVENFLALAKSQYYNNNEFYRVIKDFMIQTGDPTNTGTGSKSVVNGNQAFTTEISNQLYNIRGALSLANSGAENSSSSQFFIVQNPQDMSSQLPSTFLYPAKIKEAYKSGGYPKLDGSYTVFGQVVSGMDVVDKIADGKVKSNDTGENSKPETPYSISSIKILKDWDFTAK